MLPEFEFWTPQSLPDALEMLAASNGEAVPLAGGTNLVVDLRSGRHSPRALVDLSRLGELRGIRSDGGWITAGGCTTIAELLASPLVRAHGQPLVEAARLFANPLIRNRATLGGNLADGSPAADCAPPLLALDGEVELLSRSGCRTVPLAEFFFGVRRTALRPGEILASVRWPIPGAETRFGYTKLGLRQADAISVASAAVSLELDTGGRCSRARIALGAVAPVPLRALEAEAILEGSAVDQERVNRAARLAAGAATPISDLRATTGYRKRVSEVIVRRLLARAAQLIPQEA